MALFANQTILVTGAGGGVGEAVVRALGAQGATVCLLGRTQSNLAEVARRVPEKRGWSYPVDLTVNDELQSAVSRILAENRRIDALIHCAAIFEMGPSRPRRRRISIGNSRQMSLALSGLRNFSCRTYLIAGPGRLHEFQCWPEGSRRGWPVCGDETCTQSRGR